MPFKVKTAFLLLFLSFSFLVSCKHAVLYENDAQILSKAGKDLSIEIENIELEMNRILFSIQKTVRIRGNRSFDVELLGNALHVHKIYLDTKESVVSSMEIYPSDSLIEFRNHLKTELDSIDMEYYEYFPEIEGFRYLNNYQLNFELASGFLDVLQILNQQIGVYISFEIPQLGVIHTGDSVLIILTSGSESGLLIENIKLSQDLADSLGNFDVPPWTEIGVGPLDTLKAIVTYYDKLGIKRTEGFNELVEITLY